MQVYSINSLSCCQPRKLMNDAPEPTPNPAPTPAPAPQPAKPEEGKASIYFTGDDDNKSSKRMRLLLVPVTALAASGLLSSCIEEPCEHRTDVKMYDTTSVNVNVNGHCSGHGGRDTIRDTIYVDRTQHDTCYVDTGSYHVTHDTIVKWKDDFVRPIPLDTLMKNLHNWGIDGTAGANIFDGTTNRNIIHYVAQENWEYNNYEIGDINLLQSSKNRLVYDVENFDYKDRHISYGKLIKRIPTSNFTVQTESGKRLNSPKGTFYDIYVNNTNNKNADIEDCEMYAQFFCQTSADGKIVKIYTKNKNGIYVEDGEAAKGYLQEGTSILLRNMIGEYDTEHHLTNVHVSACDDETLKALYVRQKDDQYAKEHGLN